MVERFVNNAKLAQPKPEPELGEVNETLKLYCSQAHK